MSQHDKTWIDAAAREIARALEPYLVARHSKLPDGLAEVIRRHCASADSELRAAARRVLALPITPWPGEINNALDALRRAVAAAEANPVQLPSGLSASIEAGRTADPSMKGPCSVP